jgi:uncharacterized membrane protein YdbT with pleckstrin-like domain
MSYVNEVLGKDERIQYQAQVSLVSYLFHFILGGLIVLGSIPELIMSVVGDGVPGGVGAVMFFWLLIGGLLLAWPYIVRANTELVLTNRRVIAKFGVVSTDTVEINLAKVESIRVRQGIFGRMLNYGDIVVGGSGATHAPFVRIADPLEYRRAYDACIAHQEKVAKGAVAD